MGEYQVHVLAGNTVVLSRQINLPNRSEMGNNNNDHQNIYKAGLVVCPSVSKWVTLLSQEHLSLSLAA